MTKTIADSLTRQEDHEAKRAALLAALERGERSPLVENHSIDAVIAELNARTTRHRF